MIFGLIVVEGESSVESTSPSYKGHRYPVEVISHCVRLYFRFPLSFREVEELMLERGMTVSHETVRRWLSTACTYKEHSCEPDHGTSGEVREASGRARPGTVGQAVRPAAEGMINPQRRVIRASLVPVFMPLPLQEVNKASNVIFSQMWDSH
jgi:putative transposase